MNSFTIKIRHLGALLLLAGMLGSCATEREIDKPGTGQGTSNVTFSVKVPLINDARTKTLDDPAESAVSTVDVFVFDSGGTLRDRAYGANIDDASTAEAVIKTFTVQLLTGTSRDIMILVNSREAIQAAYPDGVPADGSVSRSAFTGALTLTLPSSGWNAVPGSTDYKDIPMWGIKTGVDIDKDTSLTGNNSVKLSRMLARINVSLHEDIPTADFKLTSVHLYNFNRTARVIPDRDNGNWNAAVPYAELPTVPAQTITKGPVSYETMTTANREIKNAIYLFEAEKGVPFGAQEGDFMENPCIVIGGKYGNSDKETFYRVDFLVKNSGTGTVEYLDILRNFSYNVKVRSVGGPGKDNKEDALNSIPENIETVVVEWNDHNLGNIVFDGVNMLAVSQGLFEFSREARTAASEDNYLTVTTDVEAVGTTPGGWQAKVYNDQAGTGLLSDGDQTNGWMRLSQYAGTGNYPAGNEIRLLADANDTGADRNAYIRITAGRMVYIVTVLQREAEDTLLEITGASGDPVTELIFPLTTPSAQPFTLKWSPAGSPVRVTVTEGSPAFGTGSAVTPAIGSFITGTGELVYTVDPGDAGYSGSELFYEKSARIEFELATETGTLTKSLLLRQMEFNILPDESGTYVMDGETEHRVVVKSNFPWKMEVAPGGDPKGVIREFGTQYGGGNGYKEDYIRFTLIDNLSDIDESKLEADIKIVFYQLVDGVWAPWTERGSQIKEYTLHCVAAVPVGESNTYLVKPGGAPIRIPLSRALDAQVTDLVGSSHFLATDGFAAELLWTDHADKLATTASVQRLIPTGTGGSGSLIVQPGTGTGNAVVAVRNSRTGEIVWSWHIWVTDYDPDAITPGVSGGPYTAAGANGNVYRYISTATNSRNYIWMDRNLGATTAEPGSIGVHGFTYQFGRKDPFPGPDAVSGSITQRPIYNESGLLAVGSSGIVYNTDAVPDNNLLNAIQYPMTFYYRNATPYDWYSGNHSLRNHTLWNLPAADPDGKTKTVFDPCPEGWRVPESGLQASPWQGLANYYAFSNGAEWPGIIGYFPAVPYYHTSGPSNAASPVGNFGYYWSATTESSVSYLSYGWHFTTTTHNSVHTAYPAFGFNVRCVRDY